MSTTATSGLHCCPRVLLALVVCGLRCSFVYAECAEVCGRSSHVTHASHTTPRVVTGAFESISTAATAAAATVTAVYQKLMKLTHILGFRSAIVMEFSFLVLVFYINIIIIIAIIYVALCCCEDVRRRHLLFAFLSFTYIAACAFWVFLQVDIPSQVTLQRCFV